MCHKEFKNSFILIVSDTKREFELNICQSLLITMSEPKTYFISGHTNLSEDEFALHYKDRIIEQVNQGSRFVVGDARGADAMARRLLRGYNGVTVYHIGTAPRGYNYDFATKGGFEDDDDRDAAMTRDSDDDILWIRPSDEYKKLLGNRYNPTYISGTTKNLMRRQGL